MALPLPPTLLQLRQSVGIRVGLATSGSLSLSMQAVIDEHLNQCQRELFLRATWARQVVDVQIPTVQGVREYDVPDEAGAIGAIQRLDIQDVDGSRRIINYDDAFQLEPDTEQINTPIRPTTWQYINDVIRFPQGVDAVNWPLLNCRYIVADKPLLVQTDRASVDGEALVQYATIITKEYMQVGGDQRQARAAHVQYMFDLRSASVGPGRTFDIASMRATGVPYWRWSPANGLNQPWDLSWNPWG